MLFNKCPYCNKKKLFLRRRTTHIHGIQSKSLEKMCNKCFKSFNNIK